MSELPDDDPRLTPMPKELDSPDDIVLTSYTGGEVFHLPVDSGGRKPVCSNGELLNRRPRNTLPYHRPCAVCFDEAEPGVNR